MNGNYNGREQREFRRFRESDSFDGQEDTDGSFTNSNFHFDDKVLGRERGLNRFGEERPRHDHYQDDQFKKDYDPTYEDEYGMKHPYEHGGRYNRWSDDIRSEASRESHSGKGPKGYKRSPERIREEACEILARDWYLDASDIEVSVEDNRLVLNGEVRSRKDKRHAEAIVENISGIEDVLNQIKVNHKVEGWIPGIGHVNEHVNDEGGKNG
jgi:hypothetical protein